MHSANKWRRAAAVALALGFWSGPAAAEFWPTQYFFQQTEENQIAYLTGLLDMYEYTRDEIAPDPGDWVRPCVRTFTPQTLRAQFVDWLLNDPAAWRLTPATLLIEALGEFCGR
ncbi:MAG: hypothetical protein O2905_04485 [Proteobacteria bacterium]|nr:hypothetical protein [Pseudomonadota bacterium]